mmetsp:Transcript_33666/g.85609  ORF Transcript_33666/g.85609 Transcript_33666/m.85609 type:complete len:230 (+) Transcript_33666:144-833(+)
MQAEPSSDDQGAAPAFRASVGGFWGCRSSGCGSAGEAVGGGRSRRSRLLDRWSCCGLRRGALHSAWYEGRGRLLGAFRLHLRQRRRLRPRPLLLLLLHLLTLGRRRLPLRLDPARPRHIESFQLPVRHLRHDELDGLALEQRSEALLLNISLVHVQVGLARHLDEAEALVPCDHSAAQAGGLPLLLLSLGGLVSRCPARLGGGPGRLVFAALHHHRAVEITGLVALPLP